MIPLITILAQSQIGAIIQIIILLIIAGIIAYFTAYYYYKPIYTKKINALENEKLDLERQNSGLRTEIGKLEEKLKSKEEEIEEIKKNIK